MPSLYTVVEDTHVVGGFITNLLLMYTIVKFSRKSLGTYKELLLIFAAYDVFLVALHAGLKPRVVVVETTIFGVAADWDNRYITAFYCSCNTVPFVLMIIDFLYRYWCIGRPHLIPLFSNWRFATFLVIIALVEFFLWFFVCTEVLTEKGEEIARDLLAAETGRRLGQEIKEGWLIMNHWKNNELNVPILFACMTFNTIMIGCFTIATTLGCFCYYHIFVLSGHTISAHALNMQRKLFLSVCAQTAVPLFFVYIPYLCVVNLPFFRLPVFFWDDACMLLTSCFPAWDGIIVIALMPDFRKGLLGKVYVKKTKVGSKETRSIPTMPSSR